MLADPRKDVVVLSPPLVESEKRGGVIKEDIETSIEDVEPKKLPNKKQHPCVVVLTLILAMFFLTGWMAGCDYNTIHVTNTRSSPTISIETTRTGTPTTTSSNSEGWVNNYNSEEEPKLVRCFEGDYLLCYDGVCNIKCTEFDEWYDCKEVSSSEFEKCQNDTYVNLPIRSSIPSEIGYLTNLKAMRAASYMMTNFPKEAWNMTSLEIIDWSYNDGPVFDIPTEIGQLTNLRIFDMLQSDAKGKLWTEIGLLTNLQHLSAAWASISGTIPTEIGLLTELTHLRLGASSSHAGSGQLSGTIPTEIGLLTKLTILELQQSLLSGSIPSEIGNLRGLTSLNLFQNPNLSGPIPSEIGNLLNLTKGINLSQTNLSGRIPNTLCSITFDDIVESGLLVSSCDAFECGCCSNANVNRNYNYPPCNG